MKDEIHVFTSAALNYLPKTRLLFDSLRRYHPEAVLHLALSDKMPATDLRGTEGIHEVSPFSELGIPQWKGWAFCHDVVELSTAIKPFVFKKILDLPNCGKVIYLDPDIVVFSRLDDILDALDDCNIVLTPHQTDPEGSLEAVIDNEICSLKHGIYNLGFLGVSATVEGRRFADWWSSRAYHFCRDDIPNGLFTDQRWIDLVPAFFSDVGIIRSTRHNVATWNLTTREFRGDFENGFTVDGQPLGFYHFTGFDSGAHRAMAKKNARRQAPVTALIDWYEDQTCRLSNDLLTAAPWAFGTFSNDERIIPSQRIVYRNRIDLQAAFPDPFEATGFLDWWKTQAPIEFPRLFDQALAEDELRTLRSCLTPGFRGGVVNSLAAARKSLLKAALHDAATRKTLVDRTRQILRTEGMVGIIRRIKTRW